VGLRRARLAPVIALAAVALGVGCGDRTEIVVVTDTDLQVPGEIDRVRFVVVGPRGVEKTADASLASTPRPVTLGLVHAGGALGPLDVTVIGELAGTEVIRRRARTAFVQGETLELRMDLLAGCAGVACEMDQTCVSTACTSIEIDPASLPPWSGRPQALDGAVRDGGRDAGPPRDGAPDTGMDASPDLDAGVDGGCGGGCDDAVPCTVDECVDGACAHTADDGLCDDAMACTIDACDSATGCTHTADDTLCDDGLACSADSCDPVTGCSNVPDHRMCPAGQLCDVAGGSCALAPTFTDIYAIIAAECSPCHTSGMFSGDLNMSTRDFAYADLVGVTAVCGAGNTRVIPYDSRTSLLWRKLAAVDLCGNRMPNGRSSLPPAQIDMVRDWIAAGAADN